ncbi:MAG: flagellar hook-length control protein FliK [Campylobacterales bacterium]|nr:flagellar hook-length control protein FliK [Campylobacterales bacterium]
MLKISTDKTDSPKGLLANLLSLKGEGKNDKFSLLLNSFSLGKTEAKALPKEIETLILLPQTDEKASVKKGAGTTALLKLFALGKENVKDEEFIHADILKAFPDKNIQQLISQAKSFLKEQILQKVDLKELPNTLGGLIKLAEKSGIDVRAISFESLSQTPFNNALTQTKSPLPHSTSELVKPALVAKKESSNAQNPLNSLLNSEEIGKSLNLDTEPKAAKSTLFTTSLNALLHGKKTEETLGNETKIGLESDKAQAVPQNKTEPLAQKIVESKQLIQHMAQNIKESMENYRPPFTKIKMQLNPQKFGEMEVTLVQRGNNVHININASSSALTVMMQNAHELKAQLSAQGLGDASMNFSSHQQQQNQHRRENAHSAYEKFQEFEDEFTEVATAIEIVVPRYI